MRDYEAISDKELIPFFDENIKNPILHNVLCNLMKYYTHTASSCRKYFYLSATLSIVLPTIVTFVASLSDVWSLEFINVFTALVAGLSAIISGLTSLFKWQENWIRYRMGCEHLKKECISYIAGTGKYKNDAEKDALLLQAIENVANEMNIKTNTLLSESDFYDKKIIRRKPIDGKE